ncbi:MAG: M50 family metallopeptidase [Planctomycetia bacterium]
MARLFQSLLIGATLAACWLGMQAVHEFGHVVGAWATGGRVARVVLHPLTISRTDLAENPHPAWVVWAGPVGGVLLPLVGWLVYAAARGPWAYLLRFFAGFCLIANGLYIGVGSFDRVGDCEEMLRRGSPPWTLWLFGLATTPVGFLLWHGQGRHFGLGHNARGVVDGWAAAASLAAFAALLALGLLVDGR